MRQRGKNGGGGTPFAGVGEEVPVDAGGGVGGMGGGRAAAHGSPRASRGDVSYAAVTRASVAASPHKPLFEARHSILSSDVSRNSYRGFLNLGLLILFITNARLVMENFRKYGFIVSFTWGMKLNDVAQMPLAFMLAGMCVFVAVAYAAEKVASKGRTSDNAIAMAHTLNLVALILLPIFVIDMYKPHPVASAVIMSLYIIMFMKLASYAMVNWDYRTGAEHARLAELAEKRAHAHAHLGTTTSTTTSSATTSSTPARKKKASSHSAPSATRAVVVEYPANITVGDVTYFVFAPTLVYQKHFPRSASIRKMFLFRRIAEFVILMALITGMVEQWLFPAVQNSLVTLDRRDPINMLERLLKVANINMSVWLLFFYTVFHVALNALGEVLRFGDRQFYQDWWNATNLDYFWRTWNMPVHNWILEHIFKPLQRRGVSRNVAGLMSFLFSAVFHELGVSVPFNTFKLYAFAGMLGQVPLVLLTRRFFRGHQFGNVIFWFSIMLGQPMLILIYYHDYNKAAH